MESTCQSAPGVFVATPRTASGRRDEHRGPRLHCRHRGSLGRRTGPASWCPASSTIGRGWRRLPCREGGAGAGRDAGAAIGVSGMACWPALTQAQGLKPGGRAVNLGTGPSVVRLGFPSGSLASEASQRCSIWATSLAEWRACEAVRSDPGDAELKWYSSAKGVQDAPSRPKEAEAEIDTASPENSSGLAGIVQIVERQ